MMMRRNNQKSSKSSIEYTATSTACNINSPSPTSPCPGTTTTGAGGTTIINDTSRSSETKIIMKMNVPLQQTKSNASTCYSISTAKKMTRKSSIRCRLGVLVYVLIGMVGLLLYKSIRISINLAQNGNSNTEAINDDYHTFYHNVNNNNNNNTAADDDDDETKSETDDDPDKDGHNDANNNSNAQQKQSGQQRRTKCIKNERITIAIISDRTPNNDYPLKALINSILNYTSIPVSVNIIASQTSGNYNNIQFLNDINGTDYFRVYYHDSIRLLQLARELVKTSKFRTLHYSADFALQKLFISQIFIPPATPGYANTTIYNDDIVTASSTLPASTANVTKFIVLDDDITFFSDMKPLWEEIMNKPHQISLYCPIDANRIHAYFNKKNATDNGHPTRYCNSGMMGIPVKSNFIQLATEATHNMVKQYDFTYSVADQDIVNRMLAENQDQFDFISCQWACDVNSCQGTAPNRRKCSTCPDKRCFAYHWCSKKYEANSGNRWGKPEYNFKWYYLKNSSDLLYNVFLPRVAANIENDDKNCQK